MKEKADHSGDEYSAKHGLRYRVHEVLESGFGHDPVSRLVNGVLVFLIIANVAAFSAETVPSLGSLYQPYFDLFDRVSVGIFTVEYALRIWSSIDLPGFSKIPGWKARLRFAMRPLLIVDLVAILPFYLSFIFPMDLRMLRVLRLFRFLKLARYSPALQSLGNVMRAEIRSLIGALMVMVSLILFSSSGIYFLERDVQPEYFGSIPSAAWWALATLTTVGYGDVVPITSLGRLFGGLVMIFGLGMFALPIGIIAAGFRQEAQRREFVVTWSMVAKVPMFHGLKPYEIAEIMRFLQSQTVLHDTVIFSKSDPAVAMYFIIVGQVNIEMDEQIYEVNNGDHFGEMALLEHRAHSATARACVNTSLLVLSKEDFEYLLRVNPSIDARMRQEAQIRLSEQDEQS